ncbi:MAG: hypothetical protein AB7N24_20690 [Dehalococcoidia bacterium]
MKTSFRRAAELWDSIAGPADWEAFADEFDRAIGNLSGAELDLVGDLLDRLRLAHSVPGKKPRDMQVGRAPMQSDTTRSANEG